MWTEVSLDVYRSEWMFPREEGGVREGLLESGSEKLQSPGRRGWPHWAANWPSKLLLMSHRGEETGAVAAGNWLEQGIFWQP